MPLTEAPSIAGSEPLPVAPRAGVSLRFVIGLGVSLVLHGCLLGLLMMQAGPAGAPTTTPASALLIEWREAASVAPAPPPPAPSRPAATVATSAKTTPDPAAVMAVHSEAAEARVEPEAAAAAASAVESTNATSTVAAASMPPAAADAYLWDVLAHLRRFQHYPERARRDGVEGTVWLRARVSRRGEVLRAEIEHSSGDDLLDGAAARLIARASPLPPPPTGAFAITDLRLPVEYRLSRE